MSKAMHGMTTTFYTARLLPKWLALACCRGTWGCGACIPVEVAPNLESDQDGWSIDTESGDMSSR
eukprot:scaffold248510_cov32-Tisochrysis_lutea.AAC.1